jgi:hypothetical protein
MYGDDHSMSVIYGCVFGWVSGYADGWINERQSYDLYENCSRSNTDICQRFASLVNSDNNGLKNTVLNVFSEHLVILHIGG